MILQIRRQITAFLEKYLACLKNPECNPAWQTGHAVAGFAFPWIGAGLGGVYASVHAGSGHQVFVCVVSFAVLSSIIGDILWVLPKEFIWDIKEEGASEAGGWDDALHYWVPSAVSWGIILLAAYLLGAS